VFTHGHRYSVNYGTNILVYQAKAEKAQLALYGHTHVSLCEKVGDITVFNPGSLGNPRDSKGPSYGVIKIRDGKFDCKICEVDKA
jgi:putative phosphoesterase